MKKNFLIILLSGLVYFNLSVQYSKAQCTIDSTQTIPGVYPDTIDPATAFSFYSEDITFVMILDTLGFTISNFEIANITGLPFGVSWICNNSANGCNYDPAVNLYGCVNLFGTPLIAGTYFVNVTVIATVATIGDQNINYPFQLIVLPDTVSNTGFSMTNSTGCAPLTVNFTNILTGQAGYLWDFNNGVTDTSENPTPQIYPAPGDYIVTQTVIPNIPPQYLLTEVTVNSIPENYNQGGIFDNDPLPDMYFVVSDSSGNVVYDSRPAITNTQPPNTWTVPGIPLNDEVYTLQVFDLDSFIISLGDDDLGTISFAGWGTSGSGTDSLPGINGLLDVSYTIFNQPVLPIVSTDTVHVLISPLTPAITASGPVTFCEGDSVTLTSSSTTGNQWYEDTLGLLSGDTNQTLVVKNQGGYHVVVTGSNGCTSISSNTTVIVNPLVPKPTLFAIGDTIFCALTGYSLQWYLNGTIIPGATGQNYVPLVSGTYTVIASDPIGCNAISDPLLFQGVGIEENNTVSQLEISPNPSDGNYNIKFISLKSDDFTIIVNDITGRNIINKSLNQVKGEINTRIDLANQPKGIYMLELRGENFTAIKKIVLQ